MHKVCMRACSKSKQNKAAAFPKAYKQSHSSKSPEDNTSTLFFHYTVINE